MSYVQRYDVLTVREGENEGDKSWWTKVGAAFAKESGVITVLLDALPVNGKLVLKIPEDRDQGGGGQRGGGQRQQGGGGQRGGYQGGGNQSRGGYQGGAPRQRGGGGGQQQRYRQSQPQRASEADFAPGGGPPDEGYDNGPPIDDLPF